MYLRGRAPPPGYSESRLAGMWVCSAKNSDSWPRSSAEPGDRAGADRVVGGEIADSEVHAAESMFAAWAMSDNEHIRRLALVAFVQRLTLTCTRC